MKDPKAYFIDLAVSNFNKQTGSQYDVSSFDVTSLYTPREYEAVYEVFSLNMLPVLRLRLLCNRRYDIFVGAYQLQDNGTTIHDNTDKVYVADCTLVDSLKFFEYNDVKRIWPVFFSVNAIDNAILMENGVGELLMEDGKGVIKLEN